MEQFSYEPLVSLNHQDSKYKDHTEYELISDGEGLITTEAFQDKEILIVKPDALTLLSKRAFADVSHFLRTSHLQKLSKILEDTEASKNDKFVASELLKNAVIAAEKEFPSCQDTGTAIVMGKKGEQVFTLTNDEESLSKGIFEVYQERNLRYSQLAPLSFFEEKNTKTNLPAQIEIFSTQGKSYEFLFIAKGGGSANKSFLFQKSKSLLNETSFEKFVRESIQKLGTAACPPYHLALVVGGTSAEYTLKMAKLASCGYLDTLPGIGSKNGRAFRDYEMETNIEQWARETGIGAQFGGKYFVHDVRVIRLPRHGASVPVGLAVSCSADRQIKGKITNKGIFLEKLEKNPEQFLPTNPNLTNGETSVQIDLEQPMNKIIEQLSALSVSSRVMLSGTLIVARDIAHAKLLKRLEEEGKLPDYILNFPVYYAGPAKTPDGRPSGSFGPTTSQRMDEYVELFQKAGGSLVMLGKGNRSPKVAESCAKYGGFYLGSIGGPAARLGRDCITNVEIQEYEELGMEAVWKITVKDFPAFIIVDNKGNDFFAANKNKPTLATLKKRS